jgi:hypothetical protein
MLQAWADDGAPAGDPDQAAPIPEPPGLALDGVTQRVSPPVGYATSGNQDQFVCFVLDPGIATTAWVTGLDLVPSDLSVSHHGVLMAVPPAGQAELDALVGPDGYYDCFGGVGVTGAYFLGVWVPGALPFETPEGVGIPFVAGSRLVLQMHYHPAGKSHPPEKTEVQLRVTTTRPAKQLLFSGIGNAPTAPLLLPDQDDRGVVEFRVPAGVADHTETMRFPVAIASTQRFPIVSAFPHMHYVGVDLEVDIARASPAPGEPAEECLVKVPRWNFDWQRTYLYDAPIDELPTVGNGDELTIRCLYDNTLANPFVQRGLDEQGLTQPVDVYLGEQTLDEMCIAGFGVIID